MAACGQRGHCTGSARTGGRSRGQKVVKEVVKKWSKMVKKIRLMVNQDYNENEARRTMNSVIEREGNSEPEEIAERELAAIPAS